MDDLDPELQAMSAISKALGKLENEDSRIRVLRWVAEKYTPSVIKQNGPINPPQLDSGETEDGIKSQFDDFVDLFDAVNPQTDIERVLTGAYWLQVIQNQASWNSYSVNKLLKDTGYGINSISHRFDEAQKKKPSLVRQVSKSGKSQQAKKTYKLTTAGVDFISSRVTQR